MMHLRTSMAGVLALAALAGCSSSGGGSPAATASVRTSEPVNVAMDVTDFDYRSVKTGASYLVSYAFPDATGRFVVQSAPAIGVTEPVEGVSDFATVNNDVARTIVCDTNAGKSVRIVTATPVYVAADRAYQSVYTCI